MVSRHRFFGAWLRWITPYIKPLLAWIFLVAVSRLAIHVPSVRWVCSLCLVAVIGWAAWIGYVPGVLISVLTIYVAPRFLTPGRPQPDPIGFVLFLGLLLLLSG